MPAFAGHPVRINGSVIVAANVDPSVIIRQHITVVIVPVVGEPNSRDETMEVPPMVAVVTDPSETAIAADLARRKLGIGRYTTAHKRLSVSTTIHKWLSVNTTIHKRLSVNTTIHKRLSGTATVHKRVAARHSTPAKAGTSAEAESAAESTPAAMPAAPAVTASTAAVRGHDASRK